MNYFTSLDSTGYSLSTELPQDCIDDCSASGSVDDSVEYWVNELGIDAPFDGLRDYLHGFGAWDHDDLGNHETNLRRLLWLVCCDLKEDQHQNERA